MKEVDYCFLGQGYSKTSIYMSVKVCPEVIICVRTADPFPNKFGLVMHHHEPECLQKDLFAVSKVRVAVKDQ